MKKKSLKTLVGYQDIFQHFKFMNWRIGEFVVSFFRCHKQVISKGFFLFCARVAEALILGTMMVVCSKLYKIGFQGDGGSNNSKKVGHHLWTSPKDINKVFFLCARVAEALILGTMMVGQATAFAPNYNKAVLAAARVFRLLDRKPLIDSRGQSGLRLVRTSSNPLFFY